MAESLNKNKQSDRLHKPSSHPVKTTEDFRPPSLTAAQSTTSSC